MNRTIWSLVLAGTMLVGIGPGGRRVARIAGPVDWKAVERALGRPGTMQPGDVYKFGLPRTDLTVTVAGIQLEPAFALGSWIAFKEMHSGSIAMGDLVLRDNEIAPVMAKLAEGGIEVTALHHHMLQETPRIYYMHIHGAGDPVKLAQAIRAAVDLTKTPPPPVTPTAPSASPVGFDTAGIANVLGYAGKGNGNVYQVTVPRPDTIREAGVVIPPAMGVATALNFLPTVGGKVASTGDFVLRAAEVNPVLRALREHAIDVTAVHNHMLGEEPRLFFMHFWAVGDVAQVAGGLRAALDLVGH